MSYYSEHKEYIKKKIKEYREKRTIYYRKYRATVKGRAAQQKANRKYEMLHPERKRAWDLARKLLKAPCEKCGVKPSHKHHPDPLNPLKIIHLCPLHHKEAHNP